MPSAPNVSRERVAPGTAADMNLAVAGDDASRLLAAVGGGDQHAFAALYDLVAPIVHGVAVRVTRNPSIAEEVTQEVFVEVWRLAPRFDGDRGSARGWIAAIAHRRAVDRVRSEESSRRRDSADAAQRQRPHDSVIDEVIERNDQQRVTRALAELSEQQRQALELAYFGGHSYSAVAELLGQPVGTVKGRIRDGLRKLRTTLEPGR